MWVTGYNEKITVTVATDVRDENDKPVPAVYLRDANTIVLDASLHGSQRRQAIVHEVGEYLDYRLGSLDPIDTEGRHNRTASIESQFARDLDAQGGAGIIDALYGDEGAKEKLEGGSGSIMYLPHYQDQVSDPIKVACGHCHHRHYPPIAVRSGTPAFHPVTGMYVMNRVLLCPGCERETEWVQGCTADGTPLDAIIGKTRVRDTRKHDQTQRPDVG